MTERRTVPPEMITPAPTIESRAWPRRVGQGPAEVVDVHAGPAVDLGRVLAREEGGPHTTFSPLPMAVTPWADTVNLASSATRSTPTCTAGGT